METRFWSALAVADDLRDYGFRVFEAGDASEARSVMIAGVKLDVVFTDVQMPGDGDGSGLAIWIRQHHPGVEVIITSGWAGADEKARALCHKRALVHKPYENATVLRRIHELKLQAKASRAVGRPKASAALATTISVKYSNAGTGSNSGPRGGAFRSSDLEGSSSVAAAAARKAGSSATRSTSETVVSCPSNRKPCPIAIEPHRGARCICPSAAANPIRRAHVPGNDESRVDTGAIREAFPGHLPRTLRKPVIILGVPYGIRTRVTNVKG